MSKLAERLRLDGRVALVTGASSGLGEGFAEALAENGAAVVCTARRQDRIEAVAGRINAAGGRAIAFPLDVTDSSALRQALDEAERAFGVVDILVNNAGISGTGSVLQASRSGWDETLSTNLTAAFELGRFVAQRLASASKSGSVINISSVLGVRSNADADYSVTKAGLIQLTRAMALDLAPLGIRVNCIAPGLFVSEMTDSTIQGEFREQLTAQIPLGRFGEARELDGLVVLLASDASSFMTGSVIVADGGHSAQLPGTVRHAWE